MLKQLLIKNFVFIKDAIIDFGSGFNVITGETGAGKSILLNALGITLGNKVDLGIISPGKDKIEVISTFDIEKNNLIKKKYSHLGIEDDQEIILKREISKDGKSRCLINGQPTSLSLLKEISEKLIDIHSQHQNQYLFDSDNHLYFFDQTLDLKDLLPPYKKYFFQFKELHKRYAEIEVEEMKLKEEKEFIFYSMKEFEGKFLEENEYYKLKNRLKEIENLEKDYHLLAEIKESFFGQAIPSLEKVISNLEKTSQSEGSKQKSEEINKLLYQLQEVGETILKDYGFKGNHSYLHEIDELNQKLSGTEKLLRKYSTDHNTLYKKYENLKSKIERLENLEYEKKKLSNLLKQAETQSWEVALSLHHRRKKFIPDFEEKVNKEIIDLEIKNAIFKIKLSPESETIQKKEIFQSNQLNERGIDKMEFLFSSGKGIDPKPLKKIASGGELSRIMLAIKYLLNQSLPNDTIIFDEIDTGVGGLAALKIGNKIKEISSSKQVIVVTHLPQIAKYADTHFRIEKITDQEGKSQTEVHLLNEEQRLTEFTRMIGKETSAENLKLTKKFIYEK